MSHDKKRSRTTIVESAREIDAFDTEPNVATQCIDHLLRTLGDTTPGSVVEPSAGTGNFVRAIKASALASCANITAFDLYRSNDIVLGGVDFLAWSPPPELPHPIWIIGNPPFGSRGATAFSFFNHAAKFADVIAFILPCVCRLYAKRTDEHFTLVAEKTLERDSFVMGPEAERYSVSTVWQVWRRRKPGEPRVCHIATESARRVGVDIDQRVREMDFVSVDAHVTRARSESPVEAGQRFFQEGGMMMTRASATPGRMCTNPATVGGVLARMRRLKSGNWYTHNWFVFHVPAVADRERLAAALGYSSNGACVQGCISISDAFALIEEALADTI